MLVSAVNPAHFAAFDPRCTLGVIHADFWLRRLSYFHRLVIGLGRFDHCHVRADFRPAVLPLTSFDCLGNQPMVLHLKRAE
jgi:hypothetical protein